MTPNEYLKINFDCVAANAGDCIERMRSKDYGASGNGKRRCTVMKLIFVLVKFLLSQHVLLILFRFIECGRNRAV